MKILIDTSPLKNDNAHRGVGMYTKLLTTELKKIDGLHISTDEKDLPNPDILHYPYFDLFFDTLPLWRQHKTIVTVHDVIPLIYPDFYKPGVKGKLRFYKQRFALQAVQAVITDSHSSKKDIMQFLKIPEKKIHVVYLAANPNLRHLAKNETMNILKEHHLPERYVLYVGDINYNKNLPQLIKSLKFLPDEYHLVCVGKNFFPQSIPEWQWIETQMALSDVIRRVHFVTDIGADADEVLSAFYSGATLYIQPSLYEGFGLPILEAMQCKTPVVSTRNSSLVEVGGKYVEFVETDAESLATGMKNIFGWSEVERAKKITAAFTWSQEFTWQKAAAETVSVYKEVVQK